MNATTQDLPAADQQFSLSRFDQTRHIGRRPVTLASLGQVLRWRWKMVLAVAGLVMLAGAILALVLTPRYQSTSKIRITPVGALPSVLDDTRDQPLDQALVNTEIATIRSRDVARKVVDQNGLGQDAEFVAARLRVGQTPADRARATEAAITSLMERLLVEQQEKSYVLAISVSSQDSAKAARLANGFAGAYIDKTADVLMSTAARQAASGQAALERLSAQAENAAASVAQYRAATGIVQGGNGGTISDQQIGPLSMQLATAEAQAAAARSNVDAAQRQIANGGADAVSAVLSSSVIATLRSQRSEAERSRAQLAARYGPKFPALVEADQQISALEQQIRQEQGRIIEGLKSEARAAEAQAASLRGQLNTLKKQIASNNSAAVKADSLQRNADAATTAYRSMAGNVQQTSQAQRSNEPQARLLEQAVIAARPTFPNRPALLFASLLAGLVLGLGAALVSEGVQARLRSADDIEILLNLRFLAAVPRLSRRQMQSEEGAPQSPADSLFHQPISAYSEAFRTVRNTLRRRQAEGAKVIALGSTLPLEGKTTSSLTLARVMAMSGQKVLLIDGDIRRAGIRKAMGRAVEVGLVEVLRGDATVEQVLIEDAFDGLTVLPVTKPSFIAQDLFSSDRMRDLVAGLRDSYDAIIIDTPPLLGVTDARTLASLADGVVLVVRWGHTPLAAVDAAIAGLEQDQSKIIGAVLTMVDPHSEAMGALYYSQYYNGYYQQ